MQASFKQALTDGAAPRVTEEHAARRRDAKRGALNLEDGLICRGPGRASRSIQMNGTWLRRSSA